MNTKAILTGLTCGVLCLTASADERVFTYSYEPGTIPKGELEFEQWITARAGRNTAVGQNDFYRLQFREEIEYGVTENYQVSLYFNHGYTHFKDPSTGARTSDYRQEGFSLENIYMVFHTNSRSID